MKEDPIVDEAKRGIAFLTALIFALLIGGYLLLGLIEYWRG